MSSHPNAMLLVTITPDDSSRKTFRDMAAHEGSEISEGSADIRIGGRRFSASVMENDYDEGKQISAEEGQIVMYGFLTYGYGEQAPWHEVAALVDAVETWAEEACARFKFTYKISISANYW